MAQNKTIPLMENYQKNLMDLVVYHEKNQNKSTRLLGEVQRVEKWLKIHKNGIK